LRGSRRPDGFTLTWSLVGSAILAEAAFSVAKDHIHHSGQTVFHRRTSADERPKHARQQRQLHKLKTLFPLDLVAGFAQRRLTGTNNWIYKVETEKTGYDLGLT
jgi:hypothetical protein